MCVSGNTTENHCSPLYLAYYVTADSILKNSGKRLHVPSIFYMLIFHIFDPEKWECVTWGSKKCCLKVVIQDTVE